MDEILPRSEIQTENLLYHQRIFLALPIVRLLLLHTYNRPGLHSTLIYSKLNNK